MIFKHTIHKAKQQDGSLLLISLIVLGVIALSSIYLSLILLNEIRSTRFADNAIISYYVSESGAEDSLWRLQYARDNSASFFDARLGTSMCAGETGQEPAVTDPEIECVSSSPPSDSDPERYFDYQTLSVAADQFTAYDIARNSPVTADVYDPNDEEAGSINTGVEQLNINWYFEECTGSEGSAILETTVTPLSFVSGELTPGTPATSIDTCGCDPGNQDVTTGFYRCGPTDTNSTNVDLDTDKFYRVTFRSLDLPFKMLEMFAADAGGGVIDLPSQVEIEANGRYRESHSQVRLRVAWRDALSGIFNYVVFSEDSLIKDTQTVTSSAFTSLCGFCTDVANSPCSNNADCPGASTCSTANTTIDVIDGAASAAFCTMDHDPGGSGEDDGAGAGTGGSINQTDLGLCNLACNGLTYCGDNILQSPNGTGSGGLANDGNEQCDNGTQNSDTIADRCRTTCVDAYCGDNVTDTGEECDDANTNVFDLCDTDGTAPFSNGVCTLTFCGDGIQQWPNGVGTLGFFGNGEETCDNGPANVAACGAPGECLTDCTVCP